MLFKKINLTLCLVFLLFFFIPLKGQAENLAISMENGLRIRSGPGIEYSIIGTINKGETFTVMSEDNSNWVQLNTSFGIGWVNKEFVQIQTNDDSKKTSFSIVGEVTGDLLNVRSEPSIQSDVLGKLSHGSYIEILSQTGDWTEINFKDKTAWVSSQYIQIKENKNLEYTNSNWIGIVTTSELNVRKEPSLHSKIIGTVKKGASYKIIEKSGNWSKIEIKNSSFGWIASWYLEKSETNLKSISNSVSKNSNVKIIYNGTSIRKEANAHSPIIQIANKGDIFEVINSNNDWFEVKMQNGEKGFIAGWLVTVNGVNSKIDKPILEKKLKNKTIMLDPGHGGRDSGTKGLRGTLEKDLTFKTARILYNKLTRAGATVLFTRNDDQYISLRSRVSTASYHNVDAFISIHYDSTKNQSIRGITSYYYAPYQKELASAIHAFTINETHMIDRGVRLGDYFVLRENNKNAVLLELGFLSNPAEETIVNSDQYQEAVTNGIYKGIIKYFMQ